jgi:hypothetical protein
MPGRAHFQDAIDWRRRSQDCSGRASALSKSEQSTHGKDARPNQTCGETRIAPWAPHASGGVRGRRSSAAGTGARQGRLPMRSRAARLSQARADSVKAYLVGKGISSDSDGSKRVWSRSAN